MPNGRILMVRDDCDSEQEVRKIIKSIQNRLKCKMRKFNESFADLGGVF